MDPAVAARMLVALFATYGNWRHKPALCDSISGKSDRELLEEIKLFYLHAIRPASDTSIAHSPSIS